MKNHLRASQIKMILMDVDGTLTDGNLWVMSNGEELKSYNVKDGAGILLAHLAGIKTGIITGKTSKSLQIRAQRLKISELHQGILDKKRTLTEIQQKHSLNLEKIAYIGDDLGDREVLQSVGFSGAVSDAHPLIKESTHFVSQFQGGKGAVREFIEFILDSQEKWPTVEANFKKLTL
ncbi:HAD-IIIA family hydrolase [bacterium]|nr:HAD-IIIA family hydrolase [bacterium]